MRYASVMKWLFALLVIGACGGPTQQQVIETPAATAPARHDEAPPASTSDQDRAHLNQQFEDMDTTQRAYREAEGAKAPPPAPKKKAPPNPKKAPVEQALMPKKAPVEQAPKQ